MFKNSRLPLRTLTAEPSLTAWEPNYATVFDISAGRSRREYDVMMVKAAGHALALADEQPLYDEDTLYYVKADGDPIYEDEFSLGVGLGAEQAVKAKRAVGAVALTTNVIPLRRAVVSDNDARLPWPSLFGDAIDDLSKGAEQVFTMQNSSGVTETYLYSRIDPGQ